MSESCKDCRFIWNGSSPAVLEEDAYWGCREGPPDGINPGWVSFPKTTPDGWCGKFSPVIDLASVAPGQIVMEVSEPCALERIAKALEEIALVVAHPVVSVVERSFPICTDPFHHNANHKGTSLTCPRCGES